VLYTDTDSLLFEVETDDVYANIKASVTQYNFCDYFGDQPCYSIENKKAVSKFRDECCGWPITEFVGLRNKMYSILEAGGNNIKKAKGIPRVVTKKDILHKLYKQCPDERIKMKRNQIVFYSYAMGSTSRTK